MIKRVSAYLGLVLLALLQPLTAQSTNALRITTTGLPSGTVGQTYRAQVSATGGTQPYTFTATNNIPPGLVFSSDGVLAGTPTQSGSYRVVVTVHDSAQTSATQIYQVVIGQSPLVLSAMSLPTATTGVPYSYTVTASGGTPPYRFSSRGNIGLSINSDGQLFGTVPASIAPGNYPLDVTVTDSNGAQVSGVVSVPVVSALRLLTTSPVTTAMEGVAYSTSFQASGGTGAYTFTASSLPGFLTLSPQGVLTGTPPAGSSGNVPFQVTVTSDTMSVVGNFVLPILPPQIQIQNNSLPNAQEGVLYSATLQPTGGTAPYTFTVTNAPSWLRVSSSGVLSGTPLVGNSGASNVIFTATDARNASTTKQLALVVLGTSGNLTVTTGTPLTSGTVGSPVSVTLTASGGSGPYRWSGLGLPPGLNIAADTGLLVGTPTAPGDYIITVEAVDRNNTVAFSSIELVVAPGAVSILTNSPLAAAQPATNYLLQFDATGADPKTWSVVDGALPPGLVFSTAGVLTGTPTASGNYSFRVRATDANEFSSTKPFTLLVNPAGGSLALSEGSLAFQAVVNGDHPTPQNIAAISTATNPLNFSVSYLSPWLSATPASGVTPSNITVSVNQAGLAPGTYADEIVITSAGQVQRIPVSLTVASATGGLVAEPGSVSLVGDGQTALDQAILIRNTSGTPIDYKLSADKSFVGFDQNTGTVAANSTAQVLLNFETTTLQPGSYTASVHVDSANAALVIPVSILISSQPQIFLEQQAVLLEARSGNGVSGPRVRSDRVLTNTPDTLSFQVAQIGGAGWLNLVSKSGSTSSKSPGSFSFTTDASALAPGSYYARIEITSDAAVNSPQDFVVILNVAPADATVPSPNPFPAGLIFVAQNNSPSTQALQLFTSSDQPLSFQVSTSTLNGNNWLATDRLSGTISTNAPGIIQITADPTGLAPGVYRGEVNVSINNLAVRTDNVTLIVPRLGTSGSAATRAQVANCSATSLVVTQTGLAGNFATPASWPTPISVRLNDDCGNVIASGQVVAEFSNGDVPQFLKLTDAGNGVYANLWVPVHPLSQITVTTRAVAKGLADGKAQVTGSVSPHSSPTLVDNGTLHNLNPILGGSLAPGTIVQIYGTNLASQPAPATSLPLPTSLGNTSVLVQGKSVPLYYVSPGQINALLPSNLEPGRQYQIIVQANGALTRPQPFNTQSVSPGVARFANGTVIAQHSDYSLVTPENPAKPGEYLVIYLAGLGATTQSVADGSASPGSPLAYVTNNATVLVAGKPATVLFAGLTPGLAGLYQINFQVPTDAPNGDLRLDITQGSASAETSVLVVSK